MERPKGGWKLKKHSINKMVVRFTNKEMRTFYSYDWRSRYQPYRDEGLGLARLKRYLRVNLHSVVSAKIENRRTGEKIMQYDKYPWVWIKK